MTERVHGLVKVEYPSIDEAAFAGNPVLRGVISTDSLEHLRTDPAYQREFLSHTIRRHILDALVRRQRLPDIELGMRGDNWSFADNGEDIVILHDPIYIIDGQQRRGTLLEYLAENPGSTVRQGALIHFKTTMEWERQRFHALNLHQTRVSSAVLLKNLRSTNPGIATLYGLAMTDKDFPLRDRVSWTQQRGHKDLLTSTLYTKVILTLHGHMGGGITASSVQGMDIGTARLAEMIGLPTLRANTKEFWATIDEVWGISTLSRAGVTWLKNAYLVALANVMSDHHDFWNAKRLHITSEHKKKLNTFPINDPEIKNLAGSSGLAANAIAYHLIQHLNKGRHNLLDRRPDPMPTHRAVAGIRAKETKAAIAARRKERRETIPPPSDAMH
jgi:hypothetical protein